MYARKNLRGLGDTAGDLVKLAAAYYTGGASTAVGAALGSSGSGSGSGQAASPSQISPQISTQISPQISPNFQQQFQPQNSAMSAGTSQSIPAMPDLNNSGLYGPSAAAPGYSVQPVAASIPMPGAVGSAAADYTKYIPWVIGGLVAIMALKAYSKKAA
jgi:hypothetical protein